MSIINPKTGRYFQCPQCRSIFVDYDHHQRRFRCLMRKCGWIAEDEGKPSEAELFLADEYDFHRP